MFVYQFMVYTTAVSVVWIIQSLKIFSHLVNNHVENVRQQALVICSVILFLNFPVEAK